MITCLGLRDRGLTDGSQAAGALAGASARYD